LRQKAKKRGLDARKFGRFWKKIGFGVKETHLDLGPKIALCPFYPLPIEEEGQEMGNWMSGKFGDSGKKLLNLESKTRIWTWLREQLCAHSICKQSREKTKKYSWKVPKIWEFG